MVWSYLGLIAWSFWRVPIPGVNEPHYLTKAKHFWDPQWCAGDLFLESSNPHWVFYVTLGWLTQFASLETVAIVGRLLSLGIVAWGWQRLAYVVTGRHWAGLRALPVFLLCHVLGNWSGEWLIGGVESKVFAYGFLFAGYAAALRGEPVFAGLWIGAAISFHPIVGCWGLGAAILSCLMEFAWTGDRNGTLFSGKSSGVAAFVLLIAAAPGLVAAVSTIGAPGDAELAATHLQVAYRLAHHLDPMTFAGESHRYLFLLIVIWGLLSVSLPVRREQRLWMAIVVAALAIAAVGMAIGWGPRPVKSMPGWEWRIGLLKFYPFRLADVLVPTALSLSAAAWLEKNSLGNFGAISTAVVTGLLVTFAVSAVIPGADQTPSRLSDTEQQDWRGVCHWIQENSGSNDLVYGINAQWALKWFAERPEYANYKDCPQDAAALLEWNHRRWVISDWKRQSLKDGMVTVSELRSLHERTQISILVTKEFGPVRAAPELRAGPFRIYRLESGATGEFADRD
ncbi:MAG: hypothetical protein KDA80_15370 [Planctomycetaceae bacterium]|nr:hypothetical protein [Planctomycetaceae bacterium]